MSGEHGGVRGGDPAAVVVPCFNEERRLDSDRLAALAESGAVRLLLVNDGSSDRTLALLRDLGARCEGIEVVDLNRHVGKAEAVRVGIGHALASGASVSGYYDADLATPPEELLRLLAVLDSRPDLSFVAAARVVMLGRRIERRASRHYLGRVFATIASYILGLPVYDTQCGAKVFRATPALHAAVERPFRSSWAFDVELIGRLLSGTATVAPLPPEAFAEMPLRCWRDVAGSTLGLRDMSRALLDLAAIGVELRGLRANGREGS